MNDQMLKRSHNQLVFFAFKMQVIRLNYISYKPFFAYKYIFRTCCFALKDVLIQNKETFIKLKGKKYLQTRRENDWCKWLWNEKRNADLPKNVYHDG